MQRAQQTSLNYSIILEMIAAVRTSKFMAICAFLISVPVAELVVFKVGQFRGHYDFSDALDSSAFLWFPTLMAIIAFYAGKRIEKIWNGHFEFTSPIIYSAAAGLIIAFLAKAILEHFINLDGLNIYYGLLAGALFGVVVRFQKNK